MSTNTQKLYCVTHRTKKDGAIHISILVPYERALIIKKTLEKHKLIDSVELYRFTPIQKVKSN